MPRGELWRGRAALLWFYDPTDTVTGHEGSRGVVPEDGGDEGEQSVACTNQLTATHCGRLQSSSLRRPDPPPPPHRSFSPAEGSALSQEVMEEEN